jgi:hypothetical protein
MRGHVSTRMDREPRRRSLKLGWFLLV